MKAKQRTEVTMQTHERTVIRFGQGSPTLYCGMCQAKTRHFSVAQAVSIFELSQAAVTSLAGDNEIHSTQDARGSLMLCGNSLAAQAKE